MLVNLYGPQADSGPERVLQLATSNNYEPTQNVR
jgi:hypothetical protein